MINEIVSHLKTKGVECYVKEIDPILYSVTMNRCVLFKHKSKFHLRYTDQSTAEILVGCSKHRRKIDLCSDDGVRDWFYAMIKDMDNDFNITLSIPAPIPTVPEITTKELKREADDVKNLIHEHQLRKSK